MLFIFIFIYHIDWIFQFIKPFFLHQLFFIFLSLPIITQSKLSFGPSFHFILGVIILYFFAYRNRFNSQISRFQLH
jgi:hypothetical protein